MGRKRVIETQELIRATEELLLENGYHAFHFKMLADQLDVARTTIYEYYANKEELVTAYMLNLMERILTECEALSSGDTPIEKLKGILRIFVKYSQIHKIIIIIPQVNADASQETRNSLQKLSKQHHALFQLILSIIREGKAEKLIREDVPEGIIAGLFFHSIQIHRQDDVPLDLFVDQLFDILCHGFVR